MKKIQLPLFGIPLFWFITQLIILFICIGYIEFIYYQNIYPDLGVKEKFLETECLVLSKQLTGQGKIIHRHRADFQVSYVANGISYTHFASGNGLDRSFTSNKTRLEKTLNKFDIGNTYPCWYKPEDPLIVVLVLRHSWASTLPLMVPSTIMVIILFYLFGNLSKLLGYLFTKLQEKK